MEKYKTLTLISFSQLVATLALLLLVGGAIAIIALVLLEVVVLNTGKSSSVYYVQYICIYII